MRGETRYRHIGYSLWLTVRVLLYAPSHRQDSTYHSLCYTSRGALAGTRNSSMGPPWRIDPTTHRTMSERSYHGATSCSSDEIENKNWLSGLWSWSTRGFRFRGIIEKFLENTKRSKCEEGYLWNKEGNILFNDTLNTFYLQLYHMTSDIWWRTTQIARKKTRCHHVLFFPISSKGSFICTIPQTG